MIFCRQCGTELNDNAVFCKKCGTRIGGSKGECNNTQGSGSYNGEFQGNHYNYQFEKNKSQQLLEDTKNRGKAIFENLQNKGKELFSKLKEKVEKVNEIIKA